MGVKRVEMFTLQQSVTFPPSAAVSGEEEEEEGWGDFILFVVRISTAAAMIYRSTAPFLHFPR